MPLPRGCLVVGRDLAGVKVYLVQEALGLAGRREVYDATAAEAVVSFQRTHHLAATGRVDATTWTALDIGYPFCVDRFTSQPGVAPSASPSAHASAALAFARAQVGTRYIWGGAGPIGYDCSGLALQALYTGGRVVPGVTTDLHVRNGFNTAAAIYRSGAFAHVPLSLRRAGDLVFWGSDVHHMALYLGHDEIVEAVRPVVRIASLWAHGAPLPTVARPFPG
ncbi:MAG: C40 family peptidase [Kineosporiaceae bacterium]